MQQFTLFTTKYQSVCGELWLASAELPQWGSSKLCVCDWATDIRKEQTLGRLRKYLNFNIVEQPTDTTLLAAQELDSYFSGECRKAFAVETEAIGSNFDKQVWAALRTIPCGQTVSYLHIAELIGRPEASRAVAQACGRNPLSVFLPCHRVVAASGNLRDRKSVV